MSIQDTLDRVPHNVTLDGDFMLRWSVPKIGWGEFYFKTVDGKVHIDNEIMSKEFIKSVLNKLVDDAVLADDKPGDPA